MPFDIELNLPEWQLEPDEEFLFGDPEDYYYIDEQGNLIEPGRLDPDDPFAPEGERLGDPETPSLEDPPAAASQDFLEQATGQEIPPDPDPPPPTPPEPPDEIQFDDLLLG